MKLQQCAHRMCIPYPEINREQLGICMFSHNRSSYIKEKAARIIHAHMKILMSCNLFFVFLVVRPNLYEISVNQSVLSRQIYVIVPRIAIDDGYASAHFTFRSLQIWNMMQNLLGTAYALQFTFDDDDVSIRSSRKHV